MTEKVSTTAKGNAFRDSIKRLLELCPSFTNVQEEFPIAHQNADLYYEEHTSTGTVRVACECKDYAEPLIRSDLEKIYLKYNPLIDGKERKIDAVRVFAPLPIGSNAQMYIMQVGYKFNTLHELELGIIDFSAYLRSLEAQYKELSHVYTRPALDDDADAEDVISQWIDGRSDQPVAILAGYGMGKTTFALHLATKLAVARLQQQTTRIPILVPLSEISSQQSIEGLLGNLFSAQNRIPNYFFGLFEELNRRGRFVIILDGFDEMKHAMSLPDFKYNFSQLNRLVIPNARVVLLGRPSAFVSDSEEHHVLRGIQKIGSKELEIPGAPEYHVLKLRQFTVNQAFDFIERYVAYQGPKMRAVRGLDFSTEEMTTRIEAVRDNEELCALVQRPVQAKMVADLIVDGHVEWHSFSRYELYDIFIHRIIERETEKPVRRAVGLEDRLAFHQRLAWWLWTKARTGNFRGGDVPRQIFGRIAENSGVDVEGYRRELLSGSLLDKKLGDVYHFPHRSYLEFLVARYVLKEDWTARTLADVAEALTHEIVDFMTESSDVSRVVEWGDYIDAIEAPVPVIFMTLIASQVNASGIALERRGNPDSSPRQIYLTFLRLRLGGEEPNEQFNFLLKSFFAANRVESQLLCLLAMVVARADAPEKLRQSQAEQIGAAIVSKCAGEFERVLSASNRSGVALTMSDPYVQSFVDCFSVVRSGDISLRVDIERLFESLAMMLSEKYMLSDLPKPQPEIVAFPFARLATWNGTLVLSDRGATVSRFLNTYPNPKSLVKVLQAPSNRAGRRHQSGQ